MPKHAETSTGGPVESDLQGYGTNYVPRAYVNDQQLHTRHPDAPGVKDIEHAPMKYIALALVHLHQQIGEAAKYLQDKSRPVDEYRTQSLIADSETLVVLQPAYEMNEVIEAIIISGPPSAVTLQLGDRVFPLTIPASGVIVMSGISIRLSRSDQRQLIAAVAGDYNFELMGYADNRGGA